MVSHVNLKNTKYKGWTGWETQKTLAQLKKDWVRWSNQNHRHQSSYPCHGIALYVPRAHYGPAEQLRATIVFLLFFSTIFFKSTVYKSTGMSWVCNLPHCCGQCYIEHVSKNQMLLNVSYNCLMKCLKEIWPIDATAITLWELNDKSGDLQYDGWCMYE